VNKRANVLIVDDEPNALKVLSAILSKDDYNVITAHSTDDAIKLLNKTKVDVDGIITDLKMPGKDGIQLFEYTRENHPHIPVILLTAYGTVESAVNAMAEGVFHYFIKPPDYVRLKTTLARAVEQCRLKREVESLKKKLFDEKVRRRIIGNSPEILKIFRVIEAIKDSSSNVLICGETGTGKELVARALHNTGNRKDKRFIGVNCAAIPRELLESELFGYERGAFTGAIARRIGRFEEASGGTLFLDEISELDLGLQSKLLRVLQEREIERLGSNRKHKVDFRLVCSTNRDLQDEVAGKNFREDLFYRINVVQISVPPLRKRTGDIPYLVHEFLKEFSIREKKTVTIPPQIMNLLKKYDWPGNVRQLKNVVESAVVLAAGSEISTGDLPQELFAGKEMEDQRMPAITLRDRELEAVKEAIQKCHGNKSKASKMLGISRKSFYRKLEQLSLLP
jgi:DNA-binding NtrC family response regulator